VVARSGLNSPLGGVVGGVDSPLLGGACGGAFSSPRLGGEVDGSGEVSAALVLGGEVLLGGISGAGPQQEQLFQEAGRVLPFGRAEGFLEREATAPPVLGAEWRPPLVVVEELRAAVLEEVHAAGVLGPGGEHLLGISLNALFEKFAYAPRALVREVVDGLVRDFEIYPAYESGGEVHFAAV